MQEAARKQLLLIIAFLLPLLFVGIVVVVSVLPSARLSTGYDFLYATCQDGNPPYAYYCRPYLANLFAVENGRLIENSVPDDLDSDGDGIADVREGYRVRLFVHETSANQSREISPDEARTLLLSDLLTSPDGVAVEREYSGGGDFLFFSSGRSDWGYFLTRGNARQRLNLINESERYYYRDDIEFLGWILEP